jgi:hypothetical protein
MHEQQALFPSSNYFHPGGFCHPPLFAVVEHSATVNGQRVAGIDQGGEI